MASRSELYLYFAGYGMCLFAGFVAYVMLTAFTRPAIIAVAVYLVGFGTYQLALAAGTHEVLSNFRRSLSTRSKRGPGGEAASRLNRPGPW